MKKGIIFLLFAALLVLPFASAEILISQPAPAYSYGDMLNATITLIPQGYVNGYLSVKIICDGSEAEIHKAVYEIGGNVKKNVDLLIKLDSEVMSDIQGNCMLRASYGGEERDSSYFIITRNINVIATIDGSFIEPGNGFGISGKATKANGQLLNGFVEASSDELGVESSGSAANGEFKLDLTVPSNAMPGAYSIDVRAYEKDSNGQVNNEGSTTVGLIVKQIATSSDVALSAVSVKPGEEYSYSAVLDDQAGQAMIAEIKVSIYKPSGELFYEGIISSEEKQIFNIEKNYEPGYWKIAVDKNGITNEKNFYVEELMDASFTLNNGVLMVENTGNVPYVRVDEIIFAGTSNIIQFNIPVGESKKFLLYAPDGEYAVKVREGETSKDIGNSYLTGNAVAIKEDSLIKAGATAILVWVFIILLVGGFAFVRYKRVEKKPYTGMAPAMVRMANTNEKIQPGARLAAFERENNEPSAAGSNRQECTLVTIKIKNFEALKNSEGSAPATVDRIMGIARSRKAKIQAQDPFRTAVFIPSLTKEKDNTLAAVKFAKEVETILNDHNRKYGQKIDFGIGVNKGEMIVEYYGGDANLTSIGNVTLMTRKLAELSSADVLLSGETFRKTMGVVRAERIAEKGAYKLNHIVNRDSNSGFINNFMKRQG